MAEQTSNGGQNARPAGGPGRGRMRGPRPKIKNPGKLFKRVMGYMLKKYRFHVVAVVVCILAGVFANVQGTMFMRTLIDSYITPMLTSPSPDFSPLAAAIARVAVSI